MESSQEQPIPPLLPPEIYSNIADTMTDPRDLRSLRGVSHNSLVGVTDVYLNRLRQSFLEVVYEPKKWWDFAAYINLKYPSGLTPYLYQEEIAKLPFDVYMNLYFIYKALYQSLMMYPNFEDIRVGDDSISTDQILEAGLCAYIDLQRGTLKKEWIERISNRLYSTPFDEFLYLFINLDNVEPNSGINRIDELIDSTQRISYGGNNTPYKVALRKLSKSHFKNDVQFKKILLEAEEPSGGEIDAVKRILTYLHEKYPGYKKSREDLNFEDEDDDEEEE